MSSVPIMASEVTQFDETTYVVRVDVVQNACKGIRYSFTFLFCDNQCKLPVAANVPEHVTKFAIDTFTCYKNFVLAKQAPITKLTWPSQNYMGTGRPYDPLYD